MGKRKPRAAAVREEDTDQESSKQTTPAASDSDESTGGPPKKKQKGEKANKRGPKSSEDLCEQFGLNDVKLEYTEADYMNLTNYGLFVRMVRPQVAGANPKIASGKLAQIMEAKWREFRENNPLTKRRREEEEMKKATETKKRDEDKEESKKDKKKKEEEKRKSEEKKRKELEKNKGKKKQVDSSEAEEESDQNGADQSDEEEEEEEEASEEEKRPANRRSSGFKIRLPALTPRRNTPRERSPRSKQASEDEEMELSEEESAKKKKATPKSRAGKSQRKKTSTLKVFESDEDNNDDDDDEDKTEVEEEEEEDPIPKKRKPQKKTPAKAQKKKKVIVYEDSDDLTEEDDSSRRRAPKRSSNKRTKPISYADSDDSEQSGRKQKKSSKRAKKQQQQSEEEENFDDVDESSSEPIESDDDFSDDNKPKRRRKKTGKKEKEVKLVIPGERKSERSKKNKNMGDMTDREFEKMLKEEALNKKEDRSDRMKEKKHRDIAKEKKRLKEARKLKEQGKKGYWQKDEKDEKGEKKPEEEKDGDEKEEDDDGNDEDDHYWFCDICEDGGDLLLCDGCPRSWHQECAKIEDIPEGEWKCPKCKGDMEATDDEEEDETGHESWCRVCRDGGDVILCDTCPSVYHLHCLNPPLMECPEDEWKCPRCMIREVPLRGWVKTILTWKWSHQEKGFDEFDHTHSPDKRRKSTEVQSGQNNGNGNGKYGKKRPERLLFVKFKDYSYWECEWIPELALEVFHSVNHSMFKRRWDQDEPPALEDGSSFGKRRHRPVGDKKMEEDPYNLEDRFYKWGIKPEWLQINRIINHEGSGKNRSYLVKWQDLTYEEASWERQCNLPEGLQDWDKHVETYWTRRKRVTSEHKELKKDKPKKSALKKKLEKQPEYVDATGCTLHPYQLEGLNWMRFSWAQDTNTILADEMGLGKTIQAISILYSLWKEGYSKGPFLLSVPLSTLMNWEREFSIWAPELYVVSYTGSRENRANIREHEFSYKEGAFHQLSKAGKMREGYKIKFDVLLTSYEFVSLDQTTFKNIKWAVLVIDEAHRLKSQQSLFFRVLNEYKIDYKLLLTGTPLQNNLEELFNLLNFLEPSKFEDMDTFLDEFSEISKDEQVHRLHEMLAPHMLRRMKIDVLKDIPPKTELIVRVELSAMQKKYYKHILTKNFEALNVKGHSNQTSLMNIMMDLRKCCNHPYLFPAADVEAPLTNKGFYEGSALIKSCGKLDLLSKMLKRLKKDNHRVLIFSQMTRMLDILEDFMVHEQFGYERIDGSIMGKIRQEAIDRFNSKDSDSFVFLLSTKAGGLGINLATADTVFIYDMDWNPHNDIQAFSRAHRIGQKNKVMIYRFVSRSTVEEKMTQVAKKKMMLTELIIHRGMSKGPVENDPKEVVSKEKAESLSKQEVNDILKFGAENLFKDDEEGKVVYNDAALDNLMDRSQEEEGAVEEQEKVFGMNEYLRSFRVATYNVKEGAPEEEEEVEEQKPEEDLAAPEEDREYWQRVVGSAYEEHRLRLLQEEEAIAATLGKGKRQRKQVSRYTANTSGVNKGNQITFDDTFDERRNKKKKDLEKEIIEEEEEEEAEEQEDDDEEVKYMSDYEPESSESEEEWGEEGAEKSAEGDEEENENQEVGEDGEKRPRGRPVKEPKKTKPPEQLPPLLSKTNHQIEVLGFTARQRRAFLDAVMRYGMPPEDCYKSQWLVRDLRNKTEKVFKAYVSLFMRHLCEPISDDADKYADGVPREGLSRQHVLTRIGIMALIRKKVNEYEHKNHTHSMREFKSVKEQVGMHNLSPAAAYWKNAMAADDKEKVQTNGNDKEDKGDGKKESKEETKDTNKEDKKENEADEETDKKENESDVKKEKENVDEEKENVDEKEIKSDEKKNDKEEDEKETDEKDPKVENQERKDKDVKTDTDKECAKSETEETIKDKEENSAGTDKKSKDQEDKANEESENKTQNAEAKTEEEDTKENNGESENKSLEKTEEKMDTDQKEEETLKVNDGDQKEEKMETDEKVEMEQETKEESVKGDKGVQDKEEDSTKEGKAEEGEASDKKVVDSETGEKMEDRKDMETEEKKETKSDESEAKTNDTEQTEDTKDESQTNKAEGKSDDAKEENMDVDKKDNEKKEEEKDGEAKDTEKNGEKTDKDSKENESKEDKGKSDEDKTKKGETQQDTIRKAIEERRKKLAELRMRFYIADGGFTDLRNLWSYEESQLTPKQEFETWHRLHDFWLLSGIITHGYRHWQDILNDSRFEILNKAFQSETDKLRKGAFLNRRFQLLEQALVIEEQLKKEVRSNKALEKLLPAFKEGNPPDEYVLVDQLSDYLRRLIKDGQIPAGTDQSLVQLLIQIEGLVGDIRQATYTGMPATLARSFPKPGAQRPAAPVQATPQTKTQSRTTVQVVPSGARPGNQSVKQMLNQKRDKDDSVICID